METMQRTALFEEHQRLGARLVPFAGWEMPVQYEGVIPEVRATREGCGLFDVSHMSQLDVAGEGATEALNRIVSSDWSRVERGRVAYALLLNEAGGVIDDIMGYRLGPDEWLVVVNASRAAGDEAHLRAHLPANVSLSNRFDDQAMIAIQGPGAQKLLQPMADINLDAISWRDCYEIRLNGVRGLLARGGYTGSDGFEWMCRGDDSPYLWQDLVRAGGVPCGLGARDVLRLEAALPLYGHELREEWTPQESGCAWAAKLDKPDFIGRDALQNRPAPAHRIRALRTAGKIIPREGYPVYQGSEAVGEVTSGTLSPTLGGGIALAMVPSALEIGDEVSVQVRGAQHPARLVPTPFVAHGKKS